MRQPHLLLFDEPTNGADMEMIDSMAEAIRAFNGGVIVISHDFRLLSKVSDEIWVIDHGIQVCVFFVKCCIALKFGRRYGMGISRAIRRVSGSQLGRP
jgi:ATPase subunit of ABC transporter with duplicated ATPase domains